jgi:conjugal transfer pilus assembly protein TraW
MALALAIATAGVSAQTAEAPPPDGAQMLGKIGPTWPIAEHDLLDVMLAKARHKQEDGEAAQLEEQLHTRTRNYIEHPPSLHLARATHDSSRPFDPTLVLPVDIRDAKGHVLWAKGTRVNPLEHHSFDEALLFVDGDDQAQVSWLQRRLASDTLPALHDKVVLTGGSPTNLAEQLHLSQPLYFDQDGRLVAKFAIDAVPASVASDPEAPRQQLLIRTYDPLEQGP